MGYGDALRVDFPDLNPGVEDLLLLEAHEVAELPARAPSRELSAVLHAYPAVLRFLIARHPAGEENLRRLMAEYPAVEAAALEACEQAVVWEVADWIMYQRAPDTTTPAPRSPGTAAP